MGRRGVWDNITSVYADPYEQVIAAILRRVVLDLRYQGPWSKCGEQAKWARDAHAWLDNPACDDLCTDLRIPPTIFRRRALEIYQKNYN